MTNNRKENEEQPQPFVDDGEPVVGEADAAPLLKKPRQWLIDRTNGESRIEGGRPFCPMCWPPPPVKYLPDVLEQNACCESFGKIGAFPDDHECSRIWLMRKSLLIHFCGLVLSILACMAITSDPTMLQNFPFSSGTVTGTVSNVELQNIQFKVV